MTPHDRARDAARARGKLTVFFGAAPGAGKTYAMLEAARSERDLRRDVVVGVVETHGRYDTGAHVIGLELLPRRNGELDVDAAIARRPGLVLVDDLAHTNASGARHAKRWQDVEEIVAAGIDVYATLDVAVLESLVDVVAQITGEAVRETRETVPDRVFDDAAEVRLIDVPIDEHLERLGETRDFYTKGNLAALRELALRRMADRVDADVHRAKATYGIERAWPVAERILVCVSPSPASARLVRAARRMAAGLRAPWIAAYVEPPLRLSRDDRERVADNLRLAEELGAETVTLGAGSAAEETIRYARTRNVTKIVVGKPTHPRWRDLLGKSFLEEIVRGSEDIDVYVISGEGEGDRDDGSRARGRGGDGAPSGPRGLLAAPIAVGIATAFAWTLFGRERLPDVVMVYLLAIVLVSMRTSFASSMIATILSVLLLDFVFVPPYFSFSVTDTTHVVTFGVMFVVAVVISTLGRRSREQTEASRQRETRTARLYAMSRELGVARDPRELAEIAARHLRDAEGAPVAIVGRDRAVLARAGDVTIDPAACAWVLAHGKPAGATTDTMPGKRESYWPLAGSDGAFGGVVGVVALAPEDPRALVDPERRRMLEAFAAQIGSALERAHLAEDAQRAHVEAEAERMRSSLLSSVSHDLRTPLGVITGATSTLRLDTRDATLSPEARRELVETIDEESQRLNRLVRNLLDMTRLASGAMQPHKEWHPLDEIVGVALARVEDRAGGRAVGVDLPRDLPPVAIDAVLVEQVLINLLENALKYTPDGTPIDVSARRAAEGGAVVVEVADRGPGIPEKEREAVFEKFYRLARSGDGGAAGAASSVGAGLGLAICRGIVAAHGGRIWVDARDGGGAAFRFTLPGDADLPGPPAFGEAS